MYIIVSAKSLVSALTTLRKHANVKTGADWLESLEHKFGSDSVLIRATDDGVVTLYSVCYGKPGWDAYHGAHSSFLRLDAHSERAGSLAVPFRVLHDYAKTFAGSDMLELRSGDVAQVVDTPATSEYLYNPETKKRELVKTPATYRDEYSIVVTCGRNKARMIARAELDMPFAFRADSYDLASPVAKATTHAAFNVQYYPADATPVVVADHQVTTPTAIIVCSYDVDDDAPAPVVAIVEDAPIAWVEWLRKDGASKSEAFTTVTSALGFLQSLHRVGIPGRVIECGSTSDFAPAPMLGPAYVAPLGTPPGYILQDGLALDCVAIWHAYLDMLAAHESYAITNERGEVIAPSVAILRGFADSIAPTPIYAPAVGDVVYVTISHDNGTTTDRVVEITALRPDGFRGNDRTYRKTRNFRTSQVVMIRRYDWKEEDTARVAD